MMPPLLTRGPAPPLRRWLVLATAGVRARHGTRDCRADTPPRSPEYLIKAAYLYNFAMFVEWPAGTFRSAGRADRDRHRRCRPVRRARSTRLVEDKRINKRRIVIERLQSAQDPSHCHILFVSAPEGGRAGELAQQLRSVPVLVVDDGVSGRRRGAAVDFVVDDNKVRFSINLDAAKRHRLTISSKMLGLARSVR